MTLLEAPEQPPFSPRGKKARTWRDYEWPGTLPFVGVHICAAIGLIWFFPTHWGIWAMCFALYFVRMFGVTGGYHRYFSHRTYKTSRVMQFVLAFLAQTSGQKGALWWAGAHRTHHRNSDLPTDVHSPRHHGILYAHIGWIWDDTSNTDYGRIKDLAKYPELVLLNKLWGLPPIILGVTTWLVAGWSGLFVGFCLSTVFVYHGTFTINSLAHVWGSRRYKTTDDSRNNFVLALITMGEGWHNNHHHFMNSTRQGFFWWEVDMTYYILKAMSWVGLVWDLKAPPRRVYEPAPDTKVEPVPVRRAA